MQDCFKIKNNSYWHKLFKNCIIKKKFLEYSENELYANESNLTKMESGEGKGGINKGNICHMT